MYIFIENHDPGESREPGETEETAVKTLRIQGLLTEGYSPPVVGNKRKDNTPG